ncbi:hypothetical protein [Herbiconiux ginsengi]|uniref:Uncharacterized protein n=1 Tax=Herbiconiux ginsengi TaxID=381665 RepID=A0A1H3S6R8_9MICO|nr:hypothetical protein [Herbiconiux ginsengi]SDZ33201.1 hypothetical protein SAMN05216554_3326 [Herbiconiux ginsengi]
MTSEHTSDAGSAAAAGRPALTWRYSLIVVAAALVAVVAVRWAIVLLGDVLRRQAEEASPNSWAGVGVALLMLGVAQLATVLILALGVPIALLRRSGSRRFVWAFEAVLVLFVLILIAGYGFAAFGFPFVFGGVELGFFVFFALPLLWVVPAFAASLIPVRAAGVVVAAGLAASLASWAVTAIAGGAEQAAYNAAYHGPVFVPAGDPDELLDGYDLGWVELPDEYGGGSTPSMQLTFSSESGTGGGFFVEFYDGHEHDPCAYGCDIVGSALGGAVTHNEATPTYYDVTLDSGTVRVSGLSEEQALTVLGGLREASIDEFAGLR